MSKEGKAYSEVKVSEPQQSKYLPSGEIYELVRTMLPEWFVQGEIFGVTLNRNTVCQPHRDKKNVGETAIMFLGEYEGEHCCLKTAIASRSEACGTDTTARACSTGTRISRLV